MDNSEIYIKMLFKLPDVFWVEYNKLPEEIRCTSFDYVCSCGGIEGVAKAHSITHKEHRQIPIIRQDQLQVLSGLSWQEFDKECLKYDVPTKEQAGIQVVMNGEIIANANSK